jgi:hypothetical protein
MNDDVGRVNPPKNLLKKLHKVMSEIEAVAKKGTNKFHNYKYATEADVLHAIREKLIENNLFIVPSTGVCNVTVAGDKFLTNIWLDYRIFDVDSGESIQCTWQGQGIDNGDKGLYKAFTGGHKYFILKTFQIPTDADPENDSHDRPTQQRASYKDFPVNKTTGEVKPDYTMASEAQKKLLTDLVKERHVSLKTASEIHDSILEKKLTKKQANMYINELSALPKADDDGEYPMDSITDDQYYPDKK